VRTVTEHKKKKAEKKTYRGEARARLEETSAKVSSSKKQEGEGGKAWTSGGKRARGGLFKLSDALKLSRMLPERH